MKYAAYNEYKTSPMTWLDQLPAHWSAASLRWVSKRYAGGTPDKGNEAYWEDGEIPWINSGAVNDGYITQPSELITREGFANSSAKWIPKDALVIALAGQGKTKGMVAQLGIPTTCNQSMAALIPNHRFEPRYLYYWLTANYQNIRNLAGGEARDGLNLEMLGSIPCSVPPVAEQQTIARFLDAKTAQIDALVAQKRQLIAKLKEKRSTLIARTVTRGLPPEAAKAAGLEPHPEMKDSGVEWLGAVPAAWKVIPLKWRTRCSSGDGIATEDVEPNETSESYFPVVGGNGLMGYAANLNIDRQVLVIGRVGALCGNVHIVNPPAWITDNALVLRPKTGVFDNRYLAHVLRFRNLNDIAAKTAQPLITGTQVRDQRVPCPSMQEQIAIANFLDSECLKLDGLSGATETAIARLTEYRQAVITSAVTGKIDVRGLA
ncbi:MAG: restriction endonuclease subunit S [Acidithiobacillus sp.]